MCYWREIKDKLIRQKNLWIFFVKLAFLGGLWLIIEASQVLHTSGLNDWVIKNLIFLSEHILTFLGFDMFSKNDVVGIVGSSGVQIGAPCNALDLMALFLGILILLPGKTAGKILYSVIGILFIHILNLMRVLALIIILDVKPGWLAFNHNYTFTLSMYIVIFLAWVWWINRFSVSKNTHEVA
jgi:exosortase/archaeosortase family protein